LLSLLEELQAQAGAESNSENLNILKETIRNIQDIKNIPEDEMKDFVYSRDREDKIKAAAWICHFEIIDAASLLDTLLKDKDYEVVKATCFYISSVRNTNFLKTFLKILIENKSYEHSILKTILLNSTKVNELMKISLNEFYGEEKFTLIEEAFKASINQPLIQIGIINKLGQLDNVHAKEYLKSKLNIGNWALQFFVLENLKRLGYNASESELAIFRQLILKETAFCTWILAAINDLKKGDSNIDLLTSLNEQLAGSKTKIFNILSFLYPSDAIEKIKNNITSGIQEKEVLALEMADILLEEVHKDIIFPLFDMIPVVEKVKNLSQHFPQAVLNQEDRLKNIIFYDYAMLNNIIKAFAMKALTAMSNTIPDEITAQIYGNDFMLKEIALSEIYDHNENIFKSYIERENEISKLQISQMPIVATEHKTTFSRLNIIHVLRDQPIFKQLPFWKLNMIAKYFNPLILNANEGVSNTAKHGGKIHIFINGTVSAKTNEGGEVVLKSGDMFGFYDQSLFDRELTITEDTLLLFIQKSDFYRVLEGLPEICEVLYNQYMAEYPTPNEELETAEELFLEYS